MGWVLFPVRVAVVAVSALAILLAAVIFLSRPERPQNRRLALLLLVESVLFGSGEGLMYLTDDAASTYAFQAVSYACGAAMPFLYLRFYATLENQVSRRLRGRAVDIALIAGALIAPLHVVVDTPRYVASVVAATDGTAVWDVVWGDLTFFVFVAYLLIVVAGFAFSALTWREARSAAQRRQARLYFAAFGARDTFVVLAVAGIVSLWTWPFANAWIGVAGYIVFVPLLSYAILSAQLFDIDLKIKWTIRRGTVLTILAVVFVVVAEVAQNWLSDAYGYLAGGLTAGALLLALKPLDRVGQRVADTAMPRVEPTAAYVAYRKMEVYRAALEGALHDGDVTAREREMLRRLRESLGLTEADAAQLERDLSLPPA